MKSNWLKKRNGRYFLIGLVSLGLIFLLSFLNETKVEYLKENATNFSEIEYEKEIDLKTLYYIDVIDRSTYFAYIDYSFFKEKFYLVTDKDNYLYVVVLEDEMKNELREASDKNIIRVYGYPIVISDEVIDYVVEELQTKYPYSDISEDNISNWIGINYMDTTFPTITIYVYLVFFFLVLFFTNLLLHIRYTYRNARLKRSFTLEQWEEINNQLNNNDDPFNLFNIRFTKDYVVVLKETPVILKYSDIVWTYFYEKKEFDNLIANSLVIQTINNKKITYTDKKLFKRNIISEDVIKYLQKKNKNMVVGTGLEKHMEAQEIIRQEKLARLKNK